MLTTDKRPASLQNINLRIQKHGADRVPAADLKFGFQIPSGELDQIAPGLKETLFRQPQQEGDQMALGEKAAGTAFTVLRHPDLEPVRLKGKFPGYELTMHTDVPEGIEAKSLFLVDVELKKITVEAHDGGNASITVTASLPIDPDEIGESVLFLKEGDVLLSLVPPKAQAVAAPAISTADAAAAAIAADSE